MTRMSDEEFAEIERLWASDEPKAVSALVTKLLAALKAERQRVAELEAEKDAISNNAIDLLFSACDKHSERVASVSFSEFQAMLDPSCHLCAIAKAEAAEAKLDAVRELAEKWRAIAMSDTTTTNEAVARAECADELLKKLGD